MAKNFIFVSILYSIYALVPFFIKNNSLKFVLAAIMSAMGGILWMTIATNIPKESIPIYGLYFDTAITLSFFLVPLFFVNPNLSIYNILGVILILAGIWLTKM